MSEQHTSQFPHEILYDLFNALSKDPDLVRTVGMAEDLELAKRGLDSGQEERVWVVLLLLVVLAHLRDLDQLPDISVAYTRAKHAIQQKAEEAFSPSQRQHFREKFDV